MDKVEHKVTIRITPDPSVKPMTEKQIKKWVEQHFIGCDYGDVRVTDSLKLVKK